MKGRCWNINGNMYYSPNSDRQPMMPPQDESPVTFMPCVSRAADFEKPHWWKKETEWLGFVPTRPVPYSGVWFETLANLPRWIYQVQDGYALPGPISTQWLTIDKLIWEIVEVLGRRNKLEYLRPFFPYRWNYSANHPTQEVAMDHIEAGRDWFGIWIGLLFWMTRKIPESEVFVEGLLPPIWFQQVVQTKNNQAVLDSIRVAPLLQRFWNINRIGLWLRHPNDKRLQPPAQWFIDQGVPVWYRWGDREKASNRRGSFELIGPTDEEYQAATICPTMSQFTPGSSQPNTELSSAANAPQIIPDKGKRVATVFRLPSESGCSIWEPFFQAQERAHERKRAQETPLEWQRREQREKKPPTTSAPVYVWDWDFDSKFVREAVLKSDREETLEQFSTDEKRYDPYYNEWDCCHEFGPDDESDTDSMEVEYIDVQRPAAHIVEMANTDEDPPSEIGASILPLSKTGAELSTIESEVQYEVLKILSDHFGFVPPVPHPSSFIDFTSNSDFRSLLSALGTHGVNSSNAFFKTPIGKQCAVFFRSFTAKSDKKPNSDLWDLSMDNRQTLCFSKRLSSIRTVKNKAETLYMFDLGSSSTVPWKLTVSSASTALYVCRLFDGMSEEELAWELVQNGICFHTLQRRDTLDQAPMEKLAATMVPMRLSGHVFDKRDHDFYEKQCQSFFSLRRSRAALLRGGYLWHIASKYISLAEALRGPWGIRGAANEMFIAEDGNGIEYIDDDLTDNELEVLCGVYRTFTGVGMDVAKLSWYPLAFEGSGEDFGRWTPRNEIEWKKRNDMILNKDVDVGLRSPMGIRKWRDRLHGFKDGRQAKKRLEELSRKFLEDEAGSV
ncbi:hypothetical protein P691DRAFT_684646 [Macrolepiota fuliginosa MF-IS2]|uniref:Uncharacterized protein n=1 Tax=Macrolepiota fuliginosa MF-IS2 TaxID=1400762 RepID=A0A9P5WY35_9AGAR|nr:hypothetical protein P691DRAFT_684646 [Macrolepiota fuliginosa MF-IS2]